MSGLTSDQIAQATPVCPCCKTPLIFRPPHRRFPEDDNYVECVNGHVWRLVQEPGPEAVEG